MALPVELIKKLKEETGAGVMDIKKALEAAKGDYDQAKTVLVQKGMAKVEKRADRATAAGLVYSYIHSGGKTGSLILLGCETDFVAKTDDFKKLCHEVALQVCSEDYSSVDELLAADYIREPAKKLVTLVKECIAKLGENIEIKKFARFEI